MAVNGSRGGRATASLAVSSSYEPDAGGRGGESTMTGRASDDPGGGAPSSLPARERADMAAHTGLDAAFLQEVCEIVAGELPGVVVSFMGEGGDAVASSARERLGGGPRGAAPP